MNKNYKYIKLSKTDSLQPLGCNGSLVHEQAVIYMEQFSHSTFINEVQKVSTSTVAPKDEVARFYVSDVGVMYPSDLL